LQVRAVFDLEEVSSGAAKEAVATVAGVHIPKGNGSIAAIYTIYRSSPTSSTTRWRHGIRMPR
jgi:hypothetical protein